ncbi:MAG: 2-C-methyl-D-erythritol 4-phosphate cytidylyltransferase [Candidatus Omnitrophota bacterium]|nr:MAG: 2-C-methyl-D-erythritol 4-phosphate cytidylyltransferase [Candidatus Omnitrophota bacterium]
MKTICIVPSAGKGRRLKVKETKPFVMLGGHPLLSHTLKALEASAPIDEIIVVVSRDKLKAGRELIKKYEFNKVRAVISGGKRRFDSVRNALRKVKDADLVLIHDGVRPFISQDLIKKLLRAAKRFGAAVSAIPSRQTLKFIKENYRGQTSIDNFFIVNTPKRKFLWEAQTPQVFKKQLIVKAYKKVKGRNATDDSSLVEKLGHRVKIVKGSFRNIKITTPEDLELAKIFVKK